MCECEHWTTTVLYWYLLLFCIHVREHGYALFWYVHILLYFVFYPISLLLLLLFFTIYSAMCTILLWAGLAVSIFRHELYFVQLVAFFSSLFNLLLYQTHYNHFTRKNCEKNWNGVYDKAAKQLLVCSLWQLWLSAVCICCTLFSFTWLLIIIMCTINWLNVGFCTLILITIYATSLVNLFHSLFSSTCFFFQQKKCVDERRQLWIGKLFAAHKTLYWQ